MRYLVVVLISAAAIAAASSCDVGVAFNCFSDADCPEGQACQAGGCVEGATSGGDGSSPAGDGGGTIGDAGTGRDGGAARDGGSSADGGGGGDGGYADAGSACVGCVPGCQVCSNGRCVNKKGFECCSEQDCAGGYAFTCDPLSHTCVEEIPCEGACNDTSDCQFRCGDTAHVCSEGWCVMAECWGTEACLQSCEPDPGFCIDGFCQCFIDHQCTDYCRSDDECRDWCGDPSYSCTNYRCVQAGCSDEACADACAPRAGYCEYGDCVCETGECTSDFQCNDPGSPYCNPDTGTCVGCWNDKQCDGGPCDPDTNRCGGCTPDCDGKECGDDGCGGSCGSCAWGESCVNWRCAGCTPECGNSLCGGPDGCGGSCPGQCPDPGKECVQGSSGGWTCVSSTCDPNGTPVHGACATQEECACGNDCVKFGSAIDQPQSFGECLAHCETGGACADPADLCMCTGADVVGACTTSSCFPQGTLSGNFSGKVLNSCQDQPAQTDIGQGNMALSMNGKNVSFNMFFTCRYVDGASGSDYVVVQGLKPCGTQICPDVLILGIRTTDVKVGTINYQSGALFTEWMQYTFSGQNVSDVWIRGYGVFGSVTLSKSGTTGKQPIAGTADITMIGYNSEVCGGETGIPCN